MRALVELGANACIVGRNVAKTERVAADLAATRPGAKVLGFGAVDVRKPQDLEEAVTRCAEALGGIDFVMYVPHKLCDDTMITVAAQRRA